MTQRGTRSPKRFNELLGRRIFGNTNTLSLNLKGAWHIERCRLPLQLPIGMTAGYTLRRHAPDTIMWRARPDHEKNHGPGSDGRRA
jgi:hypothetical protein